MSIPRVCDGCSKQLPPSHVQRAQTCGGCMGVLYCGIECQEKAWPQHKLVCQEIRNLPAAKKAQKMAADSKLTPGAGDQVEDSQDEVQVYPEQSDLNAQNGIAAAQQAFLLLLKAAEQGDLEAQRKVGLAYYNGDGVFEDASEGFQWVLRAAKQGDPEAQREIGLAYYHGDGVSSDVSESFQWLLKAAEQGCAKSQYDIAECYQKGEGIPKNDKKALEWYLRAAEGGNLKAYSMLEGVYHYGMLGVSVDNEQAFSWLLKVAEGGDLEAQHTVAQRYHSAQNYEKALPWLLKLASQGSPCAFNLLGDMYKNGHGVPQHLPTALEYYRRGSGYLWRLGPFGVIYDGKAAATLFSGTLNPS